MLVVGTDHAAEAVTGFFTKFGDGGADVLPLAGLTKRQGRALLEHLGAPGAALARRRRPPTCSTRPGPDRRGRTSASATARSTTTSRAARCPDAVAAAIEARYRATEHKRRPPVTLFDDWWDPSGEAYEPGDR